MRRERGRDEEGKRRKEEGGDEEGERGRFAREAGGG